MVSILVFRTDRIGDFLISAILLKCIKINDPTSRITVITSKKNYSYIKNFSYVDDVFELKNNILDKINLIFKLRKNNFKGIIIHDNKKRSKFISFFLKSNNKISIENPDQFSHIELIKIILEKLNFSYFDESLDIFSQKKQKILGDNDFIQLHFDEKWIYNEYIKKYINIEPNKNELIKLIHEIVKKTKTKLIITTGKHLPQILKEILPQISKLNVKLYDNLNFSQLEDITLKSKILISCHGAISHIASAKKIKQIDIIDKSYNYKRWTEHFRNYTYLYRDKFDVLAEKILERL